MKRNALNRIATRKERLSLKVGLVYALVGSIWIFISDKLMEIIATSPEAAVRLSILKGVVFVLGTAVLLYVMIHRGMVRLLDTEAALRKSEAHYRELVVNANSIILRMDPGGKANFINAFGLRFFGYSREELVGRNVVGLIVPQECFANGMVSGAQMGDRGAEPEEAGKVVCEHTLRSGERRWIVWTSKPLYKDGRIEEILSIGIDITEQKQTEEALQRAYLLLRTQQEASIDGSLSVDENGAIIASNRRFSAMWSLPAEMTAQGADSGPVFQAISEKASGSEEFFARVPRVHCEEGASGPEEIRLKDGRVFECYCAPINGADGAFYGWAHHFRDITERKLMERKAAEAEAKYRDIFENSVIGIYQVTMEGYLLSVNATIADILGYDTAEELLEEADCDARRFYADAGERSRFLKVIEEQGVAREFVTKFLRKDKSVVWVSLDVRAVREASGKIRYLEGVCREVTRQKLMEEAVARAEEKYRHIFENSIIGIFQISREGAFLSLNRAMARSLGYESPEEAMEGISDAQRLLVRPEVREQLLELINKHGLAEQFEVELFRKDNSIIWGSVNVNAVRDPDGRISYLEGTMQDITDRKLLRAQLDQAQRMEAIGTLAGGIAHDFNNILTPIMGYAELSLLGAPEDSKLARNMRQVLLSANRAKDLTRRILTFSRKSGQERRPVTVSMILGEVLDLLRSSLPATIEIRRVIEEAASRSTVMAEPAQIHQVLMNLCTNAAHAMRARGGTLTVGLAETEIGRFCERVGPEAAPGMYLRLTVADTGHGMDEGVRERIFDPYFTTKGPDEGTGLGLAVVYGIVKTLRGAITVSSKPGQGSTFEVYLPKTATAQAVPTLFPAPLQGGAGVVLLVDDERAIVDMTGEMLENLGYAVVKRQDGAHALEAFKSNPQGFAAVITDMTMPKMTGAELAGEILAIRADVPIILCTGFSDGLDAEKANALGIKAFLMKPVGMRELALVLTKVLAEAKEKERPAP